MKTKDALMTIVYYDEIETEEDVDCEIRIKGSKIVVSYDDPDGPLAYIGNEKGEGHYVLRCPEREGEATLHCFKGSRIFEGHWREEDELGFWRIQTGADR